MEYVVAVKVEHLSVIRRGKNRTVVSLIITTTI